jgi:UDP-2,3-diacylglucosamine pyrophosphatase LpxH
VRLAWLSDLHLDHCSMWMRQSLAERAAADSDCCVITGDITMGTEMQLLAEFATDYAKPIFFVLGNHDFWGGSFASVAAEVRDWCKRKPNLTWLDDSPPITLVHGVQLCGVGGWYDARFGDHTKSVCTMNDWLKIADLRPHYYAGTLIPKLQDVADGFAGTATAKLLSTEATRVFFATHVPPFRQAANHEGRPTTEAYLPWYTSKVMGQALNRFARKRPEVSLTTLCGHVHDASEYRALPNHLVLTARSDYGEPTVARVFDLEATP